ncbi:type II toxin-antitoxin system VapC family toxin [Mesorhizobium xinjiangense]|uniref:type II toxin-antitoxin system VapC family toxin n=1 Tax=Mesorhizobium xinjiangense TaxID=2678685 RepID=UPI0012ED2999|nr:type II toxin-antitoxin system VapC family toxin [Mesorhizobium xinjiangense]
MPIVIDSSVAACWCLPDESSAVADAALHMLSETDLIMPSLFWFELRNVLLIGERRKRIAMLDVQHSLAFVDSLPAIVDNACVEQSLMMLARRHELTAYDAAYLEVAIRTNALLATLDKKLVRAAEAEAVPVLKAENH